MSVKVFKTFYNVAILRTGFVPYFSFDQLLKVVRHFYDAAVPFSSLTPQRERRFPNVLCHLYILHLFKRNAVEKMAPQYSTALSDAILALSAAYTSLTVYSISSFATVGFLLMASAASLGILRFSSASPSDSLINRHKYMSQLTASFGLPMIAVAYLKNWQPYLACLVATVGVSFFALQRNLGRGLVKQAGEAISAVAMLMIVLQGFICHNMYSIAGVGLFAFSALVIKTEGHFNSIPRVDLFHYALILANVLLKEGLQAVQLPDIYYKP